MREIGIGRRVSLIEKYQIPLEHLDFNYLKRCENGKEVERILRILRSGEEGNFPELEQTAKCRLLELNPKSSLLRTISPVPGTKSLGKNEAGAINQDITNWLESLKISEFESENDIKCDDSLIKIDFPIRQPEIIPIHKNCNNSKMNLVLDNCKEKEEFVKKRNPDRIRSNEYDKWERYDVAKELTKIEVEELQEEEKRKKVINNSISWRKEEEGNYLFKENNKGKGENFLEMNEESSKNHGEGEGREGKEVTTDKINLRGENVKKENKNAKEEKKGCLKKGNLKWKKRVKVVIEDIHIGL